jgi:arabinogalactan endo-1,4-beta-galactosidase
MVYNGSKHLDKVVPKNAADAKELSMHDNEDSDSNEQEEDTNDKHTDTPTSVISAASNHHDITAEVRQGLQREDRGVFMWRMIFKIIMIAVAIVLTVATYVQLSRTETRDFTNQVSTAMSFAPIQKLKQSFP